MNKLSIYGTLGPACADKNKIKEMLLSGMNGMRLNLSHCNLWDKKEWIQNYQDACKELNMEMDLLIDMKGPELRLSSSDEIITLPKGSTLTISASFLSKPIFKNVEINDILLIDDGRLQLLVESKEETYIWCKTLVAGHLIGKKSIAIQGKNITGDVLSENDIANLKESKKYGVTGIMQPFVRSARDLIIVKKTLDELGLHLKIFAKIENMDGFNALEEILPHCDEVIIARGDLGNACGLTRLPILQHKIEETCKKYGKPYMVVTQMLHSMHENEVPTRAEVSDIFHAVYNGANSIMLTGETAGGKYPVEAMKYFCDVANETMKYKGE